MPFLIQSFVINCCQYKQVKKNSNLGTKLFVPKISYCCCFWAVLDPGISMLQPYIILAIRLKSLLACSLRKNLLEKVILKKNGVHNFRCEGGGRHGDCQHFSEEGCKFAVVGIGEALSFLHKGKP